MPSRETDTAPRAVRRYRRDLDPATQREFAYYLGLIEVPETQRTALRDGDGACAVGGDRHGDHEGIEDTDVCLPRV